jgi:flagellar motor switch protein FliM
MAGDDLSQAELETLLSMTDPLVAPNAGSAASAASTYPQIALPDAPRQPRDKVLPHDFRRPQGASKERMHRLRILHEGFGRGLAIALSAMLRCIVDVKLISLDQLTYGEFVLGLEDPTCFNLVRASPLEGLLILDINPSILYPIIDRLLGGGRDGSAVVRRPLTEIELRLASRITGLALQELRRAWQRSVELELTVERVESNPRLVQVVPPGEAMMRIRFELSINNARGAMSLCIPSLEIERLEGWLSSGDRAGHGRPSPASETVKQVSENIRQSVVELVVQLAETKVTTGDMLNLRVGDIITTEKDVHSPLAVCLEGVPKFRGRPGAFKGHKAIEVEEAFDPMSASDSPSADGPSSTHGHLPPA